MHKPSDYAHAFGEQPPSHGRRPRPPRVPSSSDASDPAPGRQGAAPTEAGPCGPSAGCPAIDAPWEPLADDAQVRPGTELATFRLLYESERICVFETRDGHLTAVDVDRLA